MKIGLLTFQRTTNFGSVLQTYGLYKKIEQMGFDIQVIDYRNPMIEKAEKLQVESSIRNLKSLVKNILFQPIINKKAYNLQCFSKNHMDYSIPFFPETIIKAETSYDILLVGSDIVWGRDITNDDYNYFLEFAHDKKKKYAFAASVGNCIIRNDETRLKNCLVQFQRIAVREQEAVNWVREIAGKDANWVCDPTMLITKDEWEKLIPPTKYRGEYVLVYFDNDTHECFQSAVRYACKYKKRVYFIRYGLPIAGAKNVKPTSVNEFLGLICGADAVFTASYHGLLFSLYFHKKVVYYTRAHSSRMSSLAERLEINKSCGDGTITDHIPNIDYDKVDKKIEEFRCYSLNVLEEMLLHGKRELCTNM